MSSLKVELRGEIDKEIMDTIDGVVNARRGSSRTEIITEILREWADAKVHESIMVLRVRGINPTQAEGNRK